MLKNHGLSNDQELVSSSLETTRIGSSLALFRCSSIKIPIFNWLFLQPILYTLYLGIDYNLFSNVKDDLLVPSRLYVE